MSAFAISKTPDDNFDVAIVFSNTNPSVKYNVSEILSTKVTRRKDGGNVSHSMLDSSRFMTQGNTAFVWVKGGTVGEVYDLVVKARMVTGQELTKHIEIRVVEKL